jgi:hypothetical protein
MSIVWVVLLGVAAGIVTAGLLSSFFRMMTAKQISFGLLMSDSPWTSAIAVPLLVLSGPAVIARNAWRGRVIEGRAWGCIVASAAIVATWSFVTGILVIEAIFFVNKLVG